MRRMKATPSKSALQQINQRRSKTLTTIVRDEIAKLIASGSLLAGDRVNESEIALRLGVSRGPVREACRSLEEAGLLVGAVNQGAFVREMTLNDARELYEVRAALSGLIGKLAAQRIQDAEVLELQRLLDAMELTAAEADMPRYYQLNLQFHERLMEIAANPKLAAFYISVVNQTHLFRRRGFVQAGSLQHSNAEHRKIVAALAKRDPSAAEKALSQHVNKGWGRLAKAVTKTSKKPGADPHKPE
jgi:DNA-binding GntR family transcriptional regulator